MRSRRTSQRARGQPGRTGWMLRSSRSSKDLGNYSIHPNDGTIQGPQRLDPILLSHIKATFVELLDLVYEDPARRAARLQTSAAGTAITNSARARFNNHNTLAGPSALLLGPDWPWSPR
jgi:hypothetical protein